MFDALKYVKTVYECRSITKAADRLCITQPALSIALNKAEEDFGAKFFDRKSKPLRLTDAGRLYLEKADEVLKLENELRAELATGAVKGELRIGAAGIAMNYLIPPLLEVFQKKYPEVQTMLFEDSAFSLKDELKNGNLDLVLDTNFYDSNLNFESLFENHLLYAVKDTLLSLELKKKGFDKDEILNDSYLLEYKRRIDFKHLNHIPYLSLQSRNELYTRAEYYFAFCNAHPQAVMYFNQQLTSYRFVERGFGGAFVGDTLVKACPFDNIIFFVIDAPVPPRYVGISYAKKHCPTGTMRAFIETAKENVHDIFKQENPQIKTI